MFLPHKSDNGAVLPWEYPEAVPGIYKAGQLVVVNAAGMIAPITALLATTPPYLCMADLEVTADEPILPVTRISKEHIYETTLNEDIETLAVGMKLRVSNGGLFAHSGAGTFEVVSLDGTAEGDAVRGRWA